MLERASSADSAQLLDADASLAEVRFVLAISRRPWLPGLVTRGITTSMATASMPAACAYFFSVSPPVRYLAGATRRRQSARLAERADLCRFSRATL